MPREFCEHLGDYGANWIRAEGAYRAMNASIDRILEGGPSDEHLDLLEVAVGDRSYEVTHLRGLRFSGAQAGLRRVGHHPRTGTHLPGRRPVRLQAGVHARSVRRFLIRVLAVFLAGISSAGEDRPAHGRPEGCHEGRVRGDGSAAAATGYPVGDEVAAGGAQDRAAQIAEQGALVHGTSFLSGAGAIVPPGWARGGGSATLAVRPPAPLRWRASAASDDHPLPEVTTCCVSAA